MNLHRNNNKKTSDWQSMVMHIYASSAWITDVNGSAVQHLQYLPFGEDFVSQSSTAFDARYKFSGKEKDSETGYSYFGARYYDSDLSVWLSVDPLASKYPSISSYAYVLNNPVKLIDPDGNFVVGSDGNAVHYKKDKDGNITWSKNATDDVKRIGGAMLKTRAGRKAFNQMQKTKYGISLNISKECNSNFGYAEKHYAFDKNSKQYKIDKIDIVIFEGSLNDMKKQISNGGRPTSSQGLLYKESIDRTGNIEEAIGAVGTHEAIHATDPQNIKESIYNKKLHTNYDVESVPERAETQYLLDLIHIEKVLLKKVSMIPVSRLY